MSYTWTIVLSIPYDMNDHNRVTKVFAISDIMIATSNHYTFTFKWKDHLNDAIVIAAIFIAHFCYRTWQISKICGWCLFGIWHR
jgi:hypothetical protein